MTTSTSFKFILPLLIAMVFVQVDLYSQTPLSDQSILQAALRKYETKLNRITADQKLDLPTKQWIDQMEFRTEFNELDLNETEYTLRMRFRNDKIRQLKNDLLLMEQSLIENEIKSEIDDQSEDVFQAIIGLYFNQALDSLYTYKLELLEDKNAIETTQIIVDDEINFNDALKIKERQYEIKQELFDLRWQSQYQLSSLGLADTAYTISFMDMIQLETMSEVIGKLETFSEINLGVDNYPQKLALLEQEYLLEQNDTDALLRFAQLKYAADNDFGVARELSLGIGINIPYRKIDKGNLAQIELDKLEESLKQEERLLELENEAASEKIQFQSLLNRYTYLKQLTEDENLSLLKTEYLNSDQAEAGPLINLELMIVERKIDLLSAQKEVYEQYISSLGRIGALRLQYNTNWLSNGLNPID